MRPAGALLVLALAMAVTPGCTVAKLGAHALGPLFRSPASSKKARPAVMPDARLAVVWVGHATALIQIGDKVILTDPVFTSTVGQLSKRLVEPGVDIADLPKIDAVVVSHVHYDHLSLGSLEMLEDKVRTLVLPRGGSAYLTDFRFPSVELRPHQAWEKDGLRITAVPVAHVGFRYGVDQSWMTDAFTGYVIEHDGIKVYFGGDTAYDPTTFVQTGARYPGIELALLPIAPREPREFMRRTHVDAAEALQVFQDLGAKVMVPIHYDTFAQGGDEAGAPLRNLERARAAYAMPGRTVAPLAIGERRVFLKRGEASPSPAGPTAPPPPPAPPVTPPPVDDDVPDDDRLD